MACFLPTITTRRCITYHCLAIGLLLSRDFYRIQLTWPLRLTSPGRILCPASMRAFLPVRLPRIPTPKQAATSSTTRPALALVSNSAGRRPLRTHGSALSSVALRPSWTAEPHLLPRTHARCLASSAQLFRPLVTRPERQTVNMAPYEETLKGKYPGKLHAKRVAEYIRSKVPAATTGVIYLEGGKTRMIEDCDQEEHFR